jgi:hypothetical protein
MAATREVETQGNYNTLGWVMDADPDAWWKSQNLGDERNDLLSIVHHEMGHAHGFNQAYPQFLAARASGLTSPAVDAYLGHPLVIDAFDHFDGTIDPDSGFGAFGNEYHGVMPLGRWIITRVDLLALETIGYALGRHPSTPGRTPLLIARRYSTSGPGLDHRPEPARSTEMNGIEPSAS